MFDFVLIYTEERLEPDQFTASFFLSWVFHQEDDTRTLSTSFQAKVAGISILGTKDGEARNCTPCPAGYHSISGNTDCTICPNGTASPPGSKTCNPCKENSFAAQVFMIWIDLQLTLSSPEGAGGDSARGNFEPE